MYQRVFQKDFPFQVTRHREKTARLPSMKYLLHVGFGLCLISLMPGLNGQGEEETLKERIAVFLAPGKPLEVTRAATLEIRDLVVVALDAKGNRSAWQRDFYLGSAPMFPEQSEIITATEIEQALNQYEELISRQPDAEALLSEEMEKWREFRRQKIEEKQAEEQARLAELQASFQAYMAREYDPAQPYELETLSAIIEQGRNLQRSLPEESQTLEQFLEPWIAHAGHLREGRLYRDGKWLSAEEIRKQKEAALREQMNAFFAENNVVKIPSVVVPQMSVLLGVGVLVLTLVLILYVFLWLASSRGGTLTFGGALFLLFGLSVIGAYIYYGFKVFSGPTRIETSDAPLARPDEVKLDALKRILYLVQHEPDSNVRPEDVSVVLTDVMINRFLNEEGTLVRQGESELFDLERNRLAVAFTDQQVILYDEVIVFGKSFLMRYRLDHDISETTITFARFSVFLGNAELPGQLANHFWISMRKDLTELLSATRLPERYQLANIDDGTIEVRWRVLRTGDRETEAPQGE